MKSRMMLLSVIAFLACTWLAVPSATAGVILLDDMRKTTVYARTYSNDNEEKEAFDDSPSTPFGTFNSSIIAAANYTGAYAYARAKQNSSVTPTHMEASGEVSVLSSVKVSDGGNLSKAEALSTYCIGFDLMSPYTYELSGDVSISAGYPWAGKVLVSLSGEHGTVFDDLLLETGAFSSTGMLSAGRYYLTIEAQSFIYSDWDGFWGKDIGYNMLFDLKSVPDTSSSAMLMGIAISALGMLRRRWVS